MKNEDDEKSNQRLRIGFYVSKIKIEVKSETFCVSTKFFLIFN